MNELANAQPLLLGLYAFFLCFPLLASANLPRGNDGEPQARVRVVQPFIEWHTGPASGYPVFHASEKGEWLTLLKRRTAWLKVTDATGREGWVQVDDAVKTVDGYGTEVTLKELGFDSPQWEIGLLMGNFEEDGSTSVYGGFLMTANLSAEFWATQVSDNESRIRILHTNLVHRPFPEWRFSPFIMLGVGHIFIKSRSTHSEPEDQDSRIGLAGLGVRVHVTRNYFIRAEVKNYKIFTNQATNEEASEWNIGLSISF